MNLLKQVVESVYGVHYDVQPTVQEYHKASRLQPLLGLVSR